MLNVERNFLLSSQLLMPFKLDLKGGKINLPKSGENSNKNLSRKCARSANANIFVQKLPFIVALMFDLLSYQEGLQAKIKQQTEIQFSYFSDVPNFTKIQLDTFKSF